MQELHITLEFLLASLQHQQAHAIRNSIISWVGASRNSTPKLVAVESQKEFLYQAYQAIP